MLGCGADDGLLPPLPPPPPRPRPTGDRELDERALLDWCTATLNPEQRDVYNEVNAYLHRRREWMHQKREWQAKKRTFDELPHLAQDPGPAPAQPSAPRLFVTGPAGTGKSHVIEAIKLRVERWAREQGISGTAVLITATTGIAALNVNGITLHSALRLPLTGKFPGEKAIEKLREKYKDLVLLVVDEVSMLGASTLKQLNYALNSIWNENPELLADTYFGNCAVLLTGDFLQLPPVMTTPIFTEPWTLNKREAAEHLVAATPTHGIRWLFALFTVFILRRQMRQAGDNTFRDILNRVRLGLRVPTDMAALRARIIPREQVQSGAYLAGPLGSVPHLFNMVIPATRFNIRRVVQHATKEQQALYLFKCWEMPNPSDEDVNECPVVTRENLARAATGGHQQ